MKSRLFAFLLALTLLVSILPSAVAAPTPTTAFSINADYRYTLTGLPYSAVVQNFFFDDSTVYVTQHGGSGITYLSRLTIQGDKAVYRDHMTLNNCGRGETLAGYYYNSKLYFYVGCKIDTAATTNYSTQIARVPYEAGKTYNYTQLDRFNHLNYASKDGSRLGTLYRINACGNSQYTIFRIQTSEGSVTYSCYDTKGLNALLDANQSVNMSEAAPKSKLIYSFTQTGSSQIVRPNSSFQGVELASKNVIFTCGGAGDAAPMIGKMNSAGTYQCQATIANVGTSSINGLQSLNGKLYFAIVGDSTADGQKIYSIDLMNMGVLPTVTDSAGVATLHQLPCVNPNTEKNDYQQNMSYVIRTSKGKTIVIDGGWANLDSDNLFAYLQKVTGDPTPHVDAWFLTHPHTDHYGALVGIANNYASQITVDTFYHRMPTTAEINKYFYNDEPDTIIGGCSKVYNAVKKLKNSQGGSTASVSLNTVHSGKCNSSFDFDEVHFDILMTCEDVFWGCDNITTKYSGTKETASHNYTNETIAQLTADNLNNSSVVFRVTMGGKTILFMGDAAQSAGIMLKRYHDANKADSSKYFNLKSDIVQIAHHGTNAVQRVVYQAIDPDIALWPTPKWCYNAPSTAGVTQYYVRQWTKALGTVDFVSCDGPQVLYFPADRANAFASIPDEVRPYVFDAQYYADRYPDLERAYGTDETKLYNHFIESGLEEGRSASPYFDVRFYMNHNGEELREHCHGDYTVAFAHFLEYVYETNERQNNPKMLSPTFDCAYYGSAYADTKSLTTELALLQHFVAVGEAEGRLASQGFMGTDGIRYHKQGARVVTEGTCSSAGSIKYTCTDCGYSCTYTTETAAHTVVIDTAVAPTCTESGLTEGSHCEICGTVIVAREEIPATGHSYTYEGIDSVNHAVGCEACDYTATELHIYEEGTCICGEAESKEPVVDEAIVINHTLNLASDISVNFAVQAGMLQDYVNHYMVCEIPVYEGNEQTGTRTVTLEPTANGYFYYYTLTGLTAVNMGDVVSAQLHMEKDGQEYLSKVDTYSIAQYAYSQLDKVGADPKLKALCADLLRYGKEAQIFKAYRTDALVDAAMTDVHKVYLSDVESVTFGNTNETLTDLENPMIPWVGKALDLDSKVCLKFVFSMGTYTGELSNLTLRVSYKDSTGAEKTLTLTNAALYNPDLGYYAFTLDTLLAAELRSVVSVQIYAGDTPVSCTLRYSADTYGNNKTGTLLELCKALFAYSDSAKAYFQ